MVDFLFGDVCVCSINLYTTADDDTLSFLHYPRSWSFLLCETHDSTHTHTHTKKIPFHAFHVFLFDIDFRRSVVKIWKSRRKQEMQLQVLYQVQ